MADTSRATFSLSASAAKVIEPPRLPNSFLLEFLFDGRKPARAVTGQAMLDYVPALEGPGNDFELGTGSDYYKKYVTSCQRHFTSNIETRQDMILDRTNMNLPDNSLVAPTSIFALEHVFNSECAIKQDRALKSNGRMLLIISFMYYYQAASDVFFRVSASALDRLLAPFDVLVRQLIGGGSLLFAEFLHAKKVINSTRWPFARSLLRWVVLLFLALGLAHHDRQYAMCFAYLCEKK